MEQEEKIKSMTTPQSTQEKAIPDGSAEKLCNEGQRVIYIYTHSLNRRSKITISKNATFIRRVKDKRKRLTNICVIKVDGNKGLSKVHVNFLKLVEP